MTLCIRIDPEIFSTLPEWDVPALELAAGRTYFFRDGETIVRYRDGNITRCKAEFLPSYYLTPKPTPEQEATANSFTAGESKHVGFIDIGPLGYKPAELWGTKMVEQFEPGSISPKKIADAMADPTSRMTPVQHYAYLTIRLTIAQVEHGNDSAEADAIRDEMDIPWRHMQAEDIDRTRDFSSFINSFDLPEPLAIVSVPASNSGNTDPIDFPKIEPVANAIDGTDVVALELPEYEILKDLWEGLPWERRSTGGYWRDEHYIYYQLIGQEHPTKMRPKFTEIPF